MLPGLIEICVILLTSSKNILWDWIPWQYKFVILQFYRSEIWQRSRGAKFKVLEGLCSHFGDSQGNPVSLSFSASGVHHFRWHMAPVFILWSVLNIGQDTVNSTVVGKQYIQKRFLVNNTNKTWDKKIESQKISGRGNCLILWCRIL